MTRAEEIRILKAIYTRQVEYLDTMEMNPPQAPKQWFAPAPTAAAADTTELSKTNLQLAEDAVSQFLNGGSCMTTAHVSAGRLAKLIMLKMLRMEMPHVSMELSSLAHEIYLETKRSQ